MKTDDKKETVMIYRQPTPDVAAPQQKEETQEAVAPPVQPAQPQPDPYAGYERQAQQQYATTLADIRRRRQELEQRYQPDIDRQKRVMKIIALGKLMGQLGQLAGGGAGTPVVDKDPYQINAWNELKRMQNEQRYYGQQLDAEEKAARNNMRTGLDRLRYQDMLSKNRMAENKQRYDLMKERDMNQYMLKTDLEKLKQDFKEKAEQAKGSRQLQAIYARGAVALQTAAAKYGYSLNLAQANAILKNWLAAGSDVLREQGAFPDLSGYAPAPVSAENGNRKQGKQAFDYGDKQKFDY